jgi:uncharacterized membrane protein YedE/YeeE
MLRALGARTWLGGQPVTFETASIERKHILGSMLFGAGWSIAATCPGPILAQLGSGRWLALATAAGLLVGIALRDRVGRRTLLPSGPLISGRRYQP